MTEAAIPVSPRPYGTMLVRAGYAVTFAAIAGSIIASFQSWGDRTSLWVAVSVVVIWVGSGITAVGRVRRGQIPANAFDPARAVRSLPFGVVFAYFGPAIEQFGLWWALFLPRRTYGLFAWLGLPHLVALVPTVVLAIPELLLTAVVTTVFVTRPLQAILGADSPVLASARESLPNVYVEDAQSPGRYESSVWTGEHRLS